MHRVIGWTPAEVEALGEKAELLGPVLHALQKDEAIRIRSAGTTVERATVGILDARGQWIPRDANGREWPVALAALQAVGFTVTAEGELVAGPPHVAESAEGELVAGPPRAAEFAPKFRRGGHASAEA